MMPAPSQAAMRRAAKKERDAGKALQDFKAKTGCTGVPCFLQVEYPGIQIASFFIIAGLHTVMLDSLVTLIRMVSACNCDFV